MNHDLDAILTGFMAGPGSFIILILLAIVGLHLGVIAWEAIETRFRSVTASRNTEAEGLRR